MLQPDQMRIEEKRLLQISNTVINLQMDTKLASFTGGKGDQLNFNMTEFICIYIQELFYIAVSYLRFIDVRKLKGNERCRIPIVSDSANLEGCTLNSVELFTEAQCFSYKPY